MQKCGMTARPKDSPSGDVPSGTRKARLKLMGDARQYPLGDVQRGRWRKPLLDGAGQMTLGSMYLRDGMQAWRIAGGGATGQHGLAGMSEGLVKDRKKNRQIN